jgi:hypothetical protein
MFAIHSFCVRLIDGTITSRYVSQQEHSHTIEATLFTVSHSMEEEHEPRTSAQASHKKSHVKYITSPRSLHMDQAQHTRKPGS